MYIPSVEDTPADRPVGKIVCVGRNYAAHAAELNNPVPEQPVLFIKPADAACALANEFTVPVSQGAVHHELEIAILIGERLRDADENEVAAGISAIGLGLDLTLRDVQSGLKEKGLPWELAKAFDGACPLSGFVSAERVSDWTNLSFRLERNGVLQQEGNSRDMLNPVLPLIAHMSRHFTLNPGDVVMTGTPAGVGPLQAGDQLSLRLEDWLQVTTQVSAREAAE